MQCESIQHLLFVLSNQTFLCRSIYPWNLLISLACNNSAHLGGGLSLVEILATLYGSVMKYDVNNPEWEFRDRFILSKGHGVLPFYASLYFTGFINDDVMNTFKKNEGN